ERCAMLRHELAHVARRDHYVNLFQTVLGVVFFFHPLARYACRQLSVEREMACDDHVVSTGAEAETYAESIIKAAERSIAPIGALAGAPGGASQIALFSARQLLERRIEMILNKDRTRVTTRKLKYLLLSAALIAAIAWLLIPGHLTKSGLAQPQTADKKGKLQLLKSLGDIKAFDELIEMAVGNPDAEMRRLAAIQLIGLEGDGSANAMFELYNKSADTDVKEMVIDTFGRISEIEPLTQIALNDPSPEFRLRALQRIKWLKENSDSDDIKAWDAPGLQEQLNQLQDQPPPPPPPPPPSPVEMTVESDKALTPLRWHKDSGSVFALLREIAYASMRRDTAFFERVLADDYVGIGPDGATRNKAEEIAAVNKPESIKKFEFDDLRVSGNDDMAFATFLATVSSQTNGQDSTAQYRYTINLTKETALIYSRDEVNHIEREVGARVSCGKCHSGEMLFKAPSAKVREIAMREKGAAVETLGSIAKDEKFKHGEIINSDFIHLVWQLKIAAIHVSRKQ
ncbi:MAG TPA: M56 family metallopeptidase, partial [Blastocatellia bacterium]|nr:M56 family metallopeptidase [Blastocatellia bacterium]